ncbi:hypothetical protein EDC04DRAFT_2618459, partial [Pisolithus marmoratus]
DVENIPGWTIALSFVVGKLYANSLLGSLNTRQHLRSQGSGPESDPCMHVAHFASLPKLSDDGQNSKDGEQHLGVHEGADIDITIVPIRDRVTALRREGEV